jgi:hypothetical protein
VISRSSSSCTVTDMRATACSSGPSKVRSDAIRVRVPAGSTTTSSPVCSVPPLTIPV